MRKKFKFTFRKKSSRLNLSRKDFIGSGSPSERRYDELVKEYGDDPAFVTSLGIKIFPTGEQFVIDAKSGRIIKRDKSTRYLGRDEESGLHLYLSEDSTLDDADEAHPSFPKEKELI